MFYFNRKSTPFPLLSFTLDYNGKFFKITKFHFPETAKINLRKKIDIWKFAKINSREKTIIFFDSRT